MRRLWMLAIVIAMGVALSPWISALAIAQATKGGP